MGSPSPSCGLNVKCPQRLMCSKTLEKTRGRLWGGVPQSRRGLRGSKRHKEQAKEAWRQRMWVSSRSRAAVPKRNLCLPSHHLLRQQLICVGTSGPSPPYRDGAMFLSPQCSLSAGYCSFSVHVGGCTVSFPSLAAFPFRTITHTRSNLDSSL